MTAQNLTKLTEKYSAKEITTAVKVLVDILAIQKKEDFDTIDPKSEFTPVQIKRLQKELTAHKSGKTKYLSSNQVKHALGI